MTNTRIAERLSKLDLDSVVDRSEELPAMTEKFQNFAKGFKPLTEALKTHYDAMKTLEQTQAKALDQLAEWSKNSPLVEGEDSKVGDVQQALLKRNQEYSEKFMTDVVAYVHEWEIVVTTKVETGLKQVKELKADLDHYQKKTGTLHKQHNAVLAKDKTPDSKAVDKLQRNDVKLEIAQKEYVTNVFKLCNLINEAVECCWKDLLPLLFRMTSLDKDRLGDESAMLEASEIVDRMKTLAETHHIDVSVPPPEEPESPSSADGEKENVLVDPPKAKVDSTEEATPEKEGAC